MKISKEKAGQNRQSLVEAAARLFKEKGFDGVGVAEISKEAGLTHGALYAHFPSKDALAGEAMAFNAVSAFDKLHASQVPLRELVDGYLAPALRDSLLAGCPLAAAASDVARQDAGVSAGYTAGFRQMVGYMEARLPPGPGRHAQAVAMMAALVGAVSVSRSVQKADPALADEVLEAVRALLVQRLE